MGIVRRDKTLAGYNGNIESVVVTDATKAYSNGVLITLHGLADLNKYGREVKEAHLATAEDADAEVLMVIHPELMYDEKKVLDDYENEADKVVRAYHFFEGDIVTLTADLLPADVAVGQILVAGANGGFAVAGEGTYKVTFEVIEDAGYELTDRQKAFALAVHRN